MAAQLRAITATPIKIPVVAAISSTVATAAASTGALSAAQQEAQTSTLGLATAAQVETSAFGRQAVVLEATEVATTQLAGAQAAATSSSRANTAAAAAHARQMGQLERGAASASLTFLGLRGATLAASGAFLAGAAGVVAFSKAIGSAAQLETSLNVFQVTAGATADQMARVSEEARALGSDLTLPGVSANDAADALANLARAGLTVDESIDGVRGTLQLATAAAIDNETAVTLVASALNAFQLQGAEAVRVADLLASSANESQGSITDMGLALQQSAAAAHQAGVSLDDTVTLLTLLARAGLRGSDAGTSLRVALLRLINPTQTAQKALKELGVNIRDAVGNVRPEIFAELTQQLNRLSRAQRDATLATIFGADAFRAAAILGTAGARGFNQARVAVEKQGTAAELAGARTKGLQGALENAKNEAAALGLTLGDAFKEPSTETLNIIAGGLRNINVGLEAAGKASQALSRDNRDQADTWVELAEKAGRFNLAFRQQGFHQASFLEELERLNKALVEQQSESLKAASAIEEYRASVDAAADASEGLNNRIDESFDRFQKITEAAAAAAKGSLFLAPSEKASVASILASGTAGLGDDLAAAERELVIATKKVESFRGKGKKFHDQFVQAVKEQASAQADVDRLRTLISSQAAADAKAAAAAARQARDAADAAILQTFSTSRQQAQNRIAQAENTAGLKDDVRREQQFLDLLRTEIRVIRDRIKDEQTKRDAIAALTAIVKATQAALARLKQAQQEAAQERRDALTDILSQRLQLAELRGNRDAILAALNAAIADARKRIKAAKTLAERLDEQIALQELINRKNELLGDAVKTGNAQAEAFFSQLQAQQGFAANLLGNLIPSGKTAGLVGAPSPAFKPPAGLGPLGIIPQVGAEAAAADGRSQTSPTAGQASTTNEILRRILHQLQILTRSTESPEAIFEAKMGAAAMTGGGGNTDVM